jgi:hypothetical protein
MSFRRVIIAAISFVALGACNTAHRNIGMEDPAIGEAVKYDAALQTINPDPIYPAGAAQPGDNGELGAKAAKRYRTDTVKQVETMQTTSGGSGGGSGSTGSGGTPR